MTARQLGQLYCMAQKEAKTSGMSSKLPAHASFSRSRMVKASTVMEPTMPSWAWKPMLESKL